MPGEAAAPAEAAPAPVEAAPPVAAAPNGAVVNLGDFEVVNLISGAMQNIGELNPSGPTVLWFWAPH